MLSPEKTKSIIAINIAYLLEAYPESRDYTSRDFEKLYLKEFVAENEFERRVIDKIFKKAPSGATIKRYRAFIQNTLGLYPKTKDTDEEEEQVKKDLKGLKSLLG